VAVQHQLNAVAVMTEAEIVEIVAEVVAETEIVAEAVVEIVMVEATVVVPETDRAQEKTEEPEPIIATRKSNYRKQRVIIDTE
jgi:hypothetical protein